MRLLVIGSDGVLGTALAKVINKKRFSATFTSRQEKLMSENYVHLDLAGNLDNFNISDYTAVIYAAQSRNYKDYVYGIPDLVRINLISPEYIARKAKENKVKFIYCSTGSVYAPNNEFLKENSALKSQSQWDTYSISKYFAEQSILSISQENLILRPFFIFGSSYNNKSLIPDLLNKGLSGQEIELKGETGLEYNPISSLDAAEIILHLIEVGASGIYNIAGSEITNLRNVVEKLAEIIGFKPKFRRTPQIPPIIADISKLKNTNFKFEGNLEEKLRTYFLELKLAESGFKSQQAPNQ